MDFQELTEIEDAILRYIQSKKVSKEKLIKTFTSKIYRKDVVKRMVNVLEKNRGYIKLSDKKYLKRQVVFLDEQLSDDDWEYKYEITPLGTAYLARSSANFTSYSNISNSNIAHHSPSANQSIDITELPGDLQEKIAEFDTALEQKDGEVLKKVFAYIADKSVDVAIALATGTLMR